MKNILLTVEYDGTNFSGWQRQPDSRTVQGELEKVLTILCGQPITLHGTSRTDAGVHAFCQMAAFKGEFGIPTDRIPMAANRLLSSNKPLSIGDVRIINAREVEQGFHPRFDAVGKKYIYRIRNSPIPDIMQRNHCYQIEKPLDVNAMKKAVEFLPGEQDFKCFMASGGKIPDSTVRTIYRADVSYTKGDLNLRGEKSAHEDDVVMVDFEIIGNGFLYNMVRIILGTLVDIGLGKFSPADISNMIMSKNRQNSGHTAPPQGLYLAEVYFDKEDILNVNKRYV